MAPQSRSVWVWFGEAVGHGLGLVAQLLEECDQWPLSVQAGDQVEVEGRTAVTVRV